jgi:CubicO group peptidase (beta-lactamase class C family)
VFTVLLFPLIASCTDSGNYGLPQRFTVETSPEASGFDKERLQRVDSLMVKYVRDGVMANFVSFVARDGRIVHFKAYGYKDSNSIPVDKTDIFRWASQTKAITTVVLLTLFEENRFMLDDPIEKHLPMFAHPQVYVSGIQFRHRRILGRNACGKKPVYADERAYSGTVGNE